MSQGFNEAVATTPRKMLPGGVMDFGRSGPRGRAKRRCQELLALTTSQFAKPAMGAALGSLQELQKQLIPYHQSDNLV